MVTFLVFTQKKVLALYRVNYYTPHSLKEMNQGCQIHFLTQFFEKLTLSTLECISSYQEFLLINFGNWRASQEENSFLPLLFSKPTFSTSHELFQTGFLTRAEAIVCVFLIFQFTLPGKSFTDSSRGMCFSRFQSCQADRQGCCQHSNQILW